MAEFLVATDLSARSGMALRRAALLASAAGAGLILAHAVDDEQPASVVEAHRREAQRLLDAETDRVSAETRVACRSLVLVGDPAEAVAAAASAEGAEVLVIGPHRRRLVRDIFFGTTGERAIRAARVPVLSVHAEATGAYKAMLLALDGSEASRRALDSARRLAPVPARSVTALFVSDAPALGLARLGGATAAERIELARAAEAAGRDTLAALLPPGGFPCAVEVVVDPQGTVANAINGAAARMGCDLIAMGTTGRSGLEGVFLGSVAEQVLRRAEVDVLVVPPRSD